VEQFSFPEWTPDNHLRHSSFVDLREDKEARKVWCGSPDLANTSTP
jgi:ATP-dependent DNA ligase